VEKNSIKRRNSKMGETVELVARYGGLVVLAGLFIWQWLEDRKNYKEEKQNNAQILKELSSSNKNIAESLNLLKISIDIQANEFRQHDERAIKEFADIKQEIIKNGRRD
jgi:hypothetical protein